MVFFVLFSIVMVFFSGYYYITNQKLKEKIKALETEINTILDKKSTIKKEISTPNIKIESPIDEDSKKLLAQPAKKNKKQVSKKTVSKSNLKDISIVVPKFNPNDFIKNTSKESTNNKEGDYLDLISKEINKELTSKTIELTDYEQEQEDKAVISYQELLSLKEKEQEEQNNID